MLYLPVYKKIDVCMYIRYALLQYRLPITMIIGIKSTFRETGFYACLNVIGGAVVKLLTTGNGMITFTRLASTT